jgi:competence protein ComEA
MRNVITWVLALMICAVFVLPTVAAVDGEAAPGTEATGDGRTLLDLNSVSYEDLLGIKGIGPALAERILNYRARKGSFTSVDELLEVRGIGEKTFSRFKDHFTLAPPPSPVAKSSRPSQ